MAAPRKPATALRLVIARPKTTPNLNFEKRLYAKGVGLIAGVDEVGRGAWAGPVVAAAVVLPLDLGPKAVAAVLTGVNDSKQVTPKRREILYEVILANALTVGVGGAGPGEVDRDGIVQATRAAMIRALAMLDPQPNHLLIDAMRLPTCELPQTSIIRGDCRSLSIAAASIVAKVNRDRLMAGLEESYPGYGFAKHKGYGTQAHQRALRHLGAADIHRMSFAPLQSFGLRVVP